MGNLESLEDIVAAFEASTGAKISEGSRALIEMDYWDFEFPMTNEEILEDALRYWFQGLR